MPTTDGGAMTGMVSSTVFHFARVARVRVDDIHRIRLVFGDIQARLGRVKRHLVGLAFHGDPGYYRRCPSIQIHHVDLAVAKAGDIRPSGCRATRRQGRLGDDHPKRIFAARRARLRRTGGLAGAQVEFPVFSSPPGSCAVRVLSGAQLPKPPVNTVIESL